MSSEEVDWEPYRCMVSTGKFSLDLYNWETMSVLFSAAKNLLLHELSIVITESELKFC